MNNKNNNLVRPIRVMVVDDLAFMRKAVREMLETSPLIEVVGAARNGKDALEQVTELLPDVVTVDLYMPEMDGVEFIRAQMARQPLPVVVCSSAGQQGGRALAAMEAGAVEFVHKPTSRALDQVRVIQRDLVRAVIAAAEAQPEKLAQQPELAPPPLEKSMYERPAFAPHIEAVLVGVSTGGPRALRELLHALPADFPVPVVIVLHMPVGYTEPLAERLNQICPLEVLELSDGLEVVPGRVVLAQAGLNTHLQRLSTGQVITRLSSPESSDSLYSPSVDMLFQSGAEAYGAHVLGVVLTGMGDDGTAGAAWIKAQGGLVITEAESSSIVYGMPRSVVEAGLSNQAVPLQQIANLLVEWVQ